MKLEIKNERVKEGWVEIITETYEVEEIREEEGKKILYLKKVNENKTEYPLPGC